MRRRRRAGNEGGIYKEAKNFMPSLMLKRADGSPGPQWNLRGQPLTVGRGEDVDARVDDAVMSRLHFILEPQGRAYVIRDQNSHNGTEVNGQRVTEAMLKAGDWIRAGQSVFVYDEGFSTVIRRMEDEEDELNIQPEVRELRRRRRSSEIFPHAFPDKSDKVE